jgi:hypothetical protein
LVVTADVSDMHVVGPPVLIADGALPFEEKNRVFSLGTSRLMAHSSVRASGRLEPAVPVARNRARLIPHLVTTQVTTR